MQEYIKNYILENLNNKIGQSVYGCELAKALFKNDKMIGSITCNASKSQENLKENMKYFEHVVAYNKINFGEEEAAREQLQKDFSEYNFEIDTVTNKEDNMFKKSQLTMIETLSKGQPKENEGVEVVYPGLSVLAAKVPGGYVVMVTDKDGDVVDLQEYRMEI